MPGKPILIRLENIPPNGLGFSLSNGLFDQKNDNNLTIEKTPIIVVDIKSTSPLPLQIGDELLEVIFLCLKLLNLLLF